MYCKVANTSKSCLKVPFVFFKKGKVDVDLIRTFAKKVISQLESGMYTRDFTLPTFLKHIYFLNHVQFWSPKYNDFH